MAIINLRKHYYPLYTKDTFIEVPDEVAAVMEECRLYENRQEGRKSYYHVYSMDCSPGIENHAMFLVQSPEDLIIREIDEAAEELLLEHLAEAITHLSPTQARRLHARFALEKKFREIAPDEGISGSCACDSVTGALKKLQKILLNRKRSEEHRARTHRLIEHGAILEGVFPAVVAMEGEEVKAFLIALSRLPGAAEFAEKTMNAGNEG